MKAPTLAASALAAAAFLLYTMASRPRPGPGGPEAPQNRPTSSSVPFLIGPPSDSSPAAGHRSGPFSRTDQKAVIIPDGALEHWATQQQFLLPLTGSSFAPCRVTRARHAADGTLLSLEGVVRHHAPGRFLFHRQPAGVLPGVFAGVVYFPSLDHGYRLESSGERPVLVRLPSDQLACVNYRGPEEPEILEIPEDHPSDIPIPAYQNGIIPLQSLPGVPGVLYLDFDGEKGPHQGWGEFDAASYFFSNGKIKEIWERVAEDFAPFNLNVTTDLQVFLDAPETSRQRCIITPTTDASPGAGGVAYQGSFNWAGDTPCWGFVSGTKSCAEVVSHEFGHTLRLKHDGRTSPNESYYYGQGSGDTGWAPIMGAGFNKNLSQWSRGEYRDADNTEDDLSIIGSSNNSVSYRADDHGDDPATATPLGFTPSAEIDEEGLIETDGDIDVFRFTTTTGGVLNIAVDPVTLGPNLDLVAELHDDANTLLELSSPPEELGALLTSSVPPGTYTIRITNTGKGDPLTTGYSSYASLGQYTLSGTIPSPLLPDFLEIAENSPYGAPVGTVAPRASHGSHPLVWHIASGNALAAFQINPATGELTVANPALLDVESLSAGWNDPPVFALTVEISDTVDANLNETVRVLITVLDVNEPPTVDDASTTVLEHTMTGRTLLTVNATEPDLFDKVTFAITAGDPDARFSIDDRGNLMPAKDLAFAEQSSYTLTITATDSGSPALAGSATVTVTLIDTVEGYTPGQVEHSFFRGITGNTVSDFTSTPAFPHCPDDIDLRREVHARGDGEKYGRVVRAYLIPPRSGNYTFWIAGDDSCQLALSPDANPATATTIATINGRTDDQQWDKFGTQKSAPVALIAGQAYYLEALQKESSGSDHLSLAWEVKDGAGNTLRPREPIPGLFLAPHLMNYCPRLAPAAPRVRRNALAGTTVHDLTVTDLNAADSHFFEITSGNENGNFALNPATGRITIADNSTLHSTHLLGVRVTDGGTPPLSASSTLLISITDESAIAANGPLMEFWDLLAGNSLHTLTSSPLFPDRPGRLLELTEFDSGTANGSAFGARIRAYLTPPLSGDYTFYLASDDQGALFLSSNESPLNASQICSVSSLTNHHQWDKFPDQASAPITLVAGQRYFIEARVKEAVANDHVAVGWTGPGLAAITVLDASVLEPFDSNVAPALSPLDSFADLDAAPSAGTTVTAFDAVDSPFETLTYAILAGDHHGAFAIDPQTGILTVANPAALHGGPYSLTIGVQDAGHGGYFPLRTTITTHTIYLGDADHDRLPDAWEIAHFGSLAQNDDNDFDLDGVSNRAEFLFGSLGNDDQSFPRPEANGMHTATTAQFEFRLRLDAPPGSYHFYHSADYRTWTLLGPSQYRIISGTPVDATYQRVTVELIDTASPCFFRLGAD